MARTRVRGKNVMATAAATEGELHELAAKIRKEYGDHTMVAASKRTAPRRIPTGVFALDLATFGGLPRGRMSEFRGPRSSGKTTTMLKTIASAQRTYPDETVALVDPEHAYDPIWGAKLGVDNDKLMLVQPDTGEAAVDIIVSLMSTVEVGLVCLDSVSALVPTKEVESSADDAATPGLHARMITGMVRKVNQVLLTEAKRNHHPTLLVTNQLRARIGGWAPAGQEALQATGGKALEFFLGLIVTFRNKESLSRDDDELETLEYNDHAFRIEKFKYGGGIRSGDFRLMRRAAENQLREGDVDDAMTLLSVAARYGIYTGGGTKWTLTTPDDIRVYRKRADAEADLYADPKWYWSVRTALLALHAKRYSMPDEFVATLLDSPVARYFPGQT